MHIVLKRCMPRFYLRGVKHLKIHIVQKGDTLWEIAKQYGVDIEELKELNSHLSSPDMIMPGMKIKIPSSSKQVKTKPVPKEEVSKKEMVKKQEDKTLYKEELKKKQEQTPSKKEDHKIELKPEPKPKPPVKEGGSLQPLKKPSLSTDLDTGTLIVGSKQSKLEKQMQSKEYEQKQNHVEHKGGHPHKQYKDQLKYEQNMMPMPMPMTPPPVQQMPGYGHMYPPCCCHCMHPYHIHQPNIVYAHQNHTAKGNKMSKQPEMYKKHIFNQGHK